MPAEGNERGNKGDDARGIADVTSLDNKRSPVYALTVILSPNDASLFLTENVRNDERNTSMSARATLLLFGQYGSEFLSDLQKSCIPGRLSTRVER